MNAKEKVSIHIYKDHVIHEQMDEVVIEYRLQLVVNGTFFVSMLCSPRKLKALGVGFLFAEGVIKDYQDIKSIELEEENHQLKMNLISKDNYTYLDEVLCGERTITTGCGQGRLINYPVYNRDSKVIKEENLDYEHINELMHLFNKMSDLFRETGGVHSCALADDKSIIYMEEDVGRHNAVDKVIGHALMNYVGLEDKILLTSGRISTEIIIKIIRSRIPVIVSRSAPTHQAIDLAKKYGIRLIGFARGNRMNIYS